MKAQWEPRAKANPTLQTRQLALAESALLPSGDGADVESPGQNALRALARSGQTAHGGTGGVHEENADDRLWRLEAPKTLRSRLAVPASSQPFFLEK